MLLVVFNLVTVLAEKQNKLTLHKDHSMSVDAQTGSSSYLLFPKVMKDIYSVSNKLYTITLYSFPRNKNRIESHHKQEFHGMQSLPCQRLPQNRAKRKNSTKVYAADNVDDTGKATHMSRFC